MVETHMQAAKGSKTQTSQRRWRPAPPRGATHASVVLDKVDRGGEGAALQFAVPPAGHGKPRALDGEEDGDEIATAVGHHGIRHDGPVGAPIATIVEDATDDEQISKVGQIDELEEVVSCWSGQMLEPNGRMHPEEPMVESNELRVLPGRPDKVNERAELLETEEEKKVRIPESPKMPKSGGPGFMAVRRAP